MNTLLLSLTFVLCFLVALFILATVFLYRSIKKEQKDLKKIPVESMLFDHQFFHFTEEKKSPFSSRTEEQFIWYSPEREVRNPYLDGNTLIGTLNFKPKRFSTLLNLSDFEVEV
ncbi:Oidioi.mRNA.OKI2018_I69.chr1.g3705.t1.cds [Oikopleura dioica]|uniref:Oidioi.mRNA.OKI2018_I69.chr1.g3705.t1.cds n=1 Tax=Oikopleura dioica TaxID=34765 RepID=A0ABN7T1I7_OIKDI|nr:Oidioi.mRNA.OKI2018_I69.chr1.g3705.t1.cds [Oikopleura dioica]